MAGHRFAVALMTVVGALGLAGCDEGNAPKDAPGTIPPNAPKTSEEGSKIGAGAPGTTSKPGMPPPPAKPN